jgi:hypothetical protein
VSDPESRGFALRQVNRIAYLLDLELPDGEHVGGWAAVLAELDRDDTRVNEEVDVEALAAVEEVEPVRPVDACGLTGTRDEGRRGGRCGEANSASLEADFGMAVPVTGGSIASGEGRDEGALEDINGVDRAGRVEERGGEERDGLLDGLGESGRHGGCDGGWWVVDGEVRRGSELDCLRKKEKKKKKVYRWSRCELTANLETHWHQRARTTVGRRGDGAYSVQGVVERRA